MRPSFSYLFLQHALRHYSLVFDAVYTPKITRLLREAEESGAKIVTGLEMFIGQAYEQFERFTGLPGKTLWPNFITIYRLLFSCSSSVFFFFCPFFCCCLQHQRNIFGKLWRVTEFYLAIHLYDGDLIFSPFSSNLFTRSTITNQFYFTIQITLLLDL